MCFLDHPEFLGHQSRSRKTGESSLLALQRSTVTARSSALREAPHGEAGEGHGALACQPGAETNTSTRAKWRVARVGMEPLGWAMGDGARRPSARWAMGDGERRRTVCEKTDFQRPAGRHKNTQSVSRSEFE